MASTSLLRGAASALVLMLTLVPAQRAASYMALPHLLPVFIIGGTTVRPGEIPYQVSIQILSEHVCGGTLIARDFVVTAAHCVYGTAFTDVKVVAGIVHLDDLDSRNRQESKVSDGMINPNFNPYSSKYDIAVLKLYQPFWITKYVNQINIPLQGFIPSGDIQVSGWGSTSDSVQINSNSLRKVNLGIMSKDDCKYYYGDDVDDTMFCAVSRDGIKDACYGDSGGPCICDQGSGTNVLCGVVSAGIGCGDKDNPGTYTSVGEFVDWIVLVMGQLQ